MVCFGLVVCFDDCLLTCFLFVGMLVDFVCSVVLIAMCV